MKYETSVICVDRLFCKKHETYSKDFLNGKCERNVLGVIEVICFSLSMNHKLRLVAHGKRVMFICWKEQEGR